MSLLPASDTVAPEALDGAKVNELYDKLRIAQLEYDACDELLKTKKLGAERKKVSPLFQSCCHVTNDIILLQLEKRRYYYTMVKAKKAISNLGLDRMHIDHFLRIASTLMMCFFNSE
jgi:hypothetical protein